MHRAPRFLVIAALAACPGDDDPASDGSDESPGDDESADDDDSAGELGPTARVRIVNLVDDVTFDVYARGTDSDPVLIAEGLAFESISDYLDVPLNELSMEPEFVLMPAGEAPGDGPTWQIDAIGPDRAFITVGELSAADEQATVLVDLDQQTNVLQWRQLDETELMVGDPAMANLHIDWALFEYPPPAVLSVAVVGEPCLFDGSTAVPQPHSVAPGTFEIGVYDRQTASECTELLGSTSITAAAGDEVLVSMYHIGTEVKFLTAPISQ
jgi:hypothetical protein